MIVRPAATLTPVTPRFQRSDGIPDSVDLSLKELGLASDLLIWKAALLTLISFAVGILGGFVGLALGTVRLPALLLFGVASPIASGTNILVSTLASLMGAIGHLRGGRVDSRLVLTMGIPSFAGAFAGGFYAHRAPEALLLLAVGTLVFWQGVELLTRPSSRTAGGKVDGVPADRRPHGLATITHGRSLAAAGLGLAIGVVGGAVGLILGSLRIPAMIKILRVEPREAVGTNMFIGFVMGAAGWTGHVTQGRVDYTLIALMGSAAMAGTYIGARLTGRISLDTLVKTLGFVLLFVGALLLWRAATT